MTPSMNSPTCVCVGITEAELTEEVGSRKLRSDPPINLPESLKDEARELRGYPLVTMEMTRRVMTNVAAPEGNRAPMGQ